MATRKEIQERVDIMQAWLDGKVVQARPRDGSGCGYPWARICISEPSFNYEFDFHSMTYRIKPEPKEIWVNEYADIAYVYSSKETAMSRVDKVAIRTAVHYREVIPNED